MCYNRLTFKGEQFVGNIKDPFVGRKLVDFKDKTKEEREQFLKSVYDYCEEVDYDKTKTFEMTREWAKIYILEFLGLTDQQIQEKFQEIRNRSKKITYESKMKQRGKTSKFNPVFLEKGIRQTKVWEDNSQKEEVLKYIYDYCKSVNYDIEKMCELADSFGFSYQRIYGYAKMYATEYLGMTAKEFNELPHNIRKEQAKPEVYKMFEQALQMKEQAEAMSLLKNSGLDVIALKRSAEQWSISYKRENDLKRLMGMLDVVHQSIREEKKKIKNLEKEQESITQLPLAREMILNFMGSSPSISFFCETNNIELGDFRKMVEIIRNYDPTLFEQYSSYVDEQQAKRCSFILKRGKSMIEQMNKGVMLNDGTTREFDIIDYLLATELSYNEMLDFLKKGKVPEKDIRAFRIFMNHNKVGIEWTTKEIENTLNNQHMIGIQFDSNNNIIPDSGHEVTREEKTNIMNYIKTQNIPLCSATYNCAFKRYQKGYLAFDEKGKVKQLKF